MFYCPGLQVQPGVRSVGVQTSFQVQLQDVGVQCSLLSCPKLLVSAPQVAPCASLDLPSESSQSESEMSQSGFDTSDFDIQEDTSL